MKKIIIPAGLLIFALASCSTFREDSNALAERFEEAGVPARIDTYRSGGIELRYAETGPHLAGGDVTADVLFIHGAPGSLDAFFDFLTNRRLVSSYRLFSVDRPGYGLSDFGNPMTSLTRQAAVLAPLLQTAAEDGPVLLVGHSYGATIAVRLAMDYSDLVEGLVLVAGAVDPFVEPFFWFNQPAEWPIVKWAVPAVWQVANAEKLSHVEELEKMLPLWRELTVPIHVFHGTRDEIVPVENAYFVAGMAGGPTELTIYEGAAHFILWENRDEIVQAIVAMAEKTLP